MGGSAETTILSITRPASNPGARRGGFTLVELLLVLALLAIVLSVGLPTLSKFFKGRTLEVEGRRLLALTHHAQARAVSEGIPMELWVDEDEKAYGLEAEPGWEDHDARAVEFKLGENLSIETRQTNVVTQAVGSLLAERLLKSGETRVSESQARRQNLPTFRFLPDGSFDLTSPAGIILSDPSGAKLELRLARNRLSYEIGPPRD